MEKQLKQIETLALSQIKKAKSKTELNKIRLHYLAGKGKLTLLIKQIKTLSSLQRPKIGKLANQIKVSIKKELANHPLNTVLNLEKEWLDVTNPAIMPPQGHLHLVTEAISEITSIFEKIGFTRVHHPEIDWDWYAFESLNMPPNHPARDEWETFFIAQKPHPEFGSLVLTPHTSNGQVREMKRSKLPIRMINIGKVYRRQSDISHLVMHHQFEGLVIDKNINITNLKGTIDYFVKQFYGPKRQIRLRPFHFQFTEPSFEVDINCDICSSRGCKFCKSGWVELAGAGMVHPKVLENGGVNPKEYTGFAFGWGVERTYMMKQGLKIDDIRILYSNDMRFLEQF